MSKPLFYKIKENPNILLDDGEIGLRLTLLEEKENVLFFEKRYNGQAGYVFVVCKEYIDENEFAKYYNFYCELVKEKVKGMFKEIEFIIVSKEKNNKINEIINNYNENYVERKQIKYILL